MSRSSASSQPHGPDGSEHKGPDRRRYPRFALSLPGRFMRPDKLDYSCRLKDISVGGAAFITPTQPAVGEKVIVYLMHLGGLEGSVVRHTSDGFAMSITATQRKRDNLASRIQLLMGRADIAETDERISPRTPSTGLATLMLPDGTVLECAILDVSGTGLSVVTPIKPPVGSEVILANERAVVVRHHDEGIAVEFVNQRLEAEDAFKRIAGAIIRKDESR
jgi:c-di-GMP-binding flagellar brake protein YcgR